MKRNCFISEQAWIRDKAQKSRHLSVVSLYRKLTARAGISRPCSWVICVRLSFIGFPSTQWWLLEARISEMSSSLNYYPSPNHFLIAEYQQIWLRETLVHSWNGRTRTYPKWCSSKEGIIPMLDRPILATCATCLRFDMPKRHNSPIKCAKVGTTANGFGMIYHVILGCYVTCYT